MDIDETVSEIVDDLTSTAETAATAAFVLRKKLGLTPEAGSVPTELPKAAVDTGPRISPEEWDKSIKGGLDKAAAETPKVEHLGRLQPEKNPPPMPRAAKAAETAHAPAPAHAEGREFAHKVENHAPVKPALEARPAVTAASSHASAPKIAEASVKSEAPVVKSLSTAPTGGAHANLPAVKPVHEAHVGSSTAVRRVETTAVELAAKESANVALKTALRVAGPEVAIGVAVVSAVPDAYHFVDNASGHAISKSSLGLEVARIAESSGANAAAHKIGGMVDHASETAGRAVASAMAKTGADKALEKASDLVGRAGEASGVFGAFAKVGTMWDAGAAKLEKVIHDNVHGPDNPAQKATAPVAAAAAHPAATPPAAKAPAAAEGAHAPAGAKAGAASSHAEKEPVKHAPAAAHKTADGHAHAPHTAAAHHKTESHAPSAHPASQHHKPAAHASAPHSATSHSKAAAPDAGKVEDAKAAAVTAAAAAVETSTSPQNPGMPEAAATLTGSAGLSKALENHMETHGMGSEAKVLADPLATAIAAYLENSPNSSASLVINPKSDDIATMTGTGTTAPVAGDLPAIPSKTLESVAETGISPAGVSQLRESLPEEAKGKSDLELASIVGVNAIANIAEKGIDVQAVDKMQEHIVKGTEGTEFAVVPDKLSTVKVLHDMGEQDNKNLAVIEGSPTGNRVIGAMSESEFNKHPETPGASLAAVDVSGMRKELGMPEGPQAQQQKSEAKAAEVPMER